MTGPIALKFRMLHEGVHLTMYLHVSQLGCYCTCARARVVPESRERLNRLCSNLVQRWRPVSRVACKSQQGPTLHVRKCRVTVPDLKNGWADCAQIWYTDRDRLDGCPPTQFRRCRNCVLSLSLVCLSPQKAYYWSLFLGSTPYRASCSRGSGSFCPGAVVRFTPLSPTVFFFFTW